jgi:hypothetical protein
MSSIREQIIEAAIVALNTGRPGGVPAADRTRMEPYQAGDLPAVTVMPVREGMVHEKSSRWAYYLKRTLTFRVECRVAGNPADELLDPLLTWAGQALATPPNGAAFGGLAEDCIETLCEWQYAAQDQPYAMAMLDFTVEYVTLKADPTKAE